MPRDRTAVQPRGDVKELLKAIRDGVASIRSSKEERSAFSSDIAAAFEALEARGISREAVRMAMKYADWDEDKRAGFDAAYALVRQAIGVPFEDQLFDADGQVNTSLLKTKAAEEPEPELGEGDDKKAAAEPKREPSALH